jgi:Phage integrase family
MLFLAATYGLRACEIVALTLDAIDWRGRRLHVAQRKTSTPLVLPLTDAAGTVLLRYLRPGRPAAPYRELFLRQRAPAGVLKPTAVSEVFQKWARRSGLQIAYDPALTVFHRIGADRLRKGDFRKVTFDDGENRVRFAAAPGARTFLGAPLWLYRRLIVDFGIWVRAAARGRPDAFHEQIRWCFLLDTVFGHWKFYHAGRRAEPAGRRS